NADVQKTTDKQPKEKHIYADHDGREHDLTVPHRAQALKPTAIRTCLISKRNTRQALGFRNVSTALRSSILLFHSPPLSIIRLQSCFISTTCIWGDRNVILQSCSHNCCVRRADCRRRSIRRGATSEDRFRDRARESQLDATR